MIGLSMLCGLSLYATSTPSTSMPSLGKRISVVVGCRLPKYDTLKYTLLDAKLMAERLGTDGDCRLILSDDAEKPTKAAVMSAIRLQAEKCGPNDTFWFYWSGHGDKLRDTSYLNAYDCDPFDVKTMLNVTEIRTLLKSCKARAKVLILDSCHSGSTKGPASLGADTALAGFAGQATLAACKIDQTALESPELGHGLFTFFLVRGLAGEAADSSGTVTLSSLKEYSVNNVVEFAKVRGHEQEPQFIFDSEQATQVVSTTTPGTNPAPIPTNATVQPMQPLPPGVAVLVDGTSATAASLSAKLKRSFVDLGLPVLGEEHSSAFSQAIQANAGNPAAAMEQWRSRFLVRAHVTAEVTPSTDAQGVVTATVTISGELVDSNGQSRHAFETVQSGIGGNPATATNRALDKALTKFLEELRAQVQKALGR